MTTMRYLDVITIAVDKVQARYNGAKLLAVQGLSPKGPTTAPKDITELTAVFSATPETKILIRSTKWGEWLNIESEASHNIENTHFSWPVEIDVEAARELKAQAGYNRPFQQVTLQRTSASETEPQYVFTMAQSHIAVGASTGTLKVIATTDTAWTN